MITYLATMTTLTAALAAAPPAAAPPPALIANENLVLDGIPRIPAVITERVGGYGELRTAAFQGWVPGKREMIITTRFGDTSQLHVVRFPGGARRQLSFFSDRVQGAELPRRGGNSFALLKDTGGGEFNQIYRSDPTGGFTLLTDGKSKNDGPVWSHAANRIAYTSTRRNGKDTDLYLMAPADPKSDRRLAEVNGGGWAALDWSPDDQRLLVQEEISIRESYLWLFDTTTGERTALIARDTKGAAFYGEARFAPDAKAIYVITDRGSDFRRLARVDVATREHSFLTASIPWDVEALALSSDGRLLVFATNEDGASLVRLLDTESGAERALPRLPAGVVNKLQWREGSSEVGFTFSSPRSPADAWSLDVKSGKLERWTESETGGLDPALFPEPELIHWKSFDGYRVSGYLYRPPARFTGKRPVMISVHGGPEGQARPGYQGRNNFWLNEMGLAIVQPNVRGSTGYGRSFADLDNGVLREDSVKDLGALLDWLQEQGNLDAGRVMVTGGSYGGYMTLAAATHYSDRVRCFLDVVGISNFVTFLEHTEAYRRDLRRVEYGDERDPKMREHLLAIAPALHADRITRPLFVVQGQNDPRVPWTESEQMVATVKKNGTPVWYLMAKDEGHGFAKKKNQDFQFAATVAFVEEFLLK